jgi:hypothetical protein
LITRKDSALGYPAVLRLARSFRFHARHNQSLPAAGNALASEFFLFAEKVVFLRAAGNGGLVDDT